MTFTPEQILSAIWPLAIGAVSVYVAMKVSLTKIEERLKNNDEKTVGGLDRVSDLERRVSAIDLKGAERDAGYAAVTQTLSKMEHQLSTIGAQVHDLALNIAKDFGTQNGAIREIQRQLNVYAGLNASDS